MKSEIKNVFTLLSVACNCSSLRNALLKNTTNIRKQISLRLDLIYNFVRHFTDLVLRFPLVFWNVRTEKSLKVYFQKRTEIYMSAR